MLQNLACMIVYPMGIKRYDQILIPINLEKVKLHRAVLQRLVLKGVKIARNVAKVGVNACLSNGHPKLWSNFNSEKIVKSETSSCIFAIIRLTSGPNSSKDYKIWHARLYIKRVSKSMIKFQFWEFGQK